MKRSTRAGIDFHIASARHAVIELHDQDLCDAHLVEAKKLMAVAKEENAAELRAFIRNPWNWVRLVVGIVGLTLLIIFL